MERDCKNCIYANWNGNDNGCTKWDCEFVNRKDAISKTKTLQIAWEILPQEWYDKLEAKI